MGYASFLEDIGNKLSDMNLMIDQSSLSHTLKTQTLTKENIELSSEEIDELYESFKFTKRQLIESRSKLHETETKRKQAASQIGKMGQIINALRQQNHELKNQVSKKDNLLHELKKQIISILEKNEVARKIAENKSQEILINTVKNTNSEHAEIIMDLKSGIAQIGCIVQQQNFHKKIDNINNIKLIIKRLTNLG